MQKHIREGKRIKVYGKVRVKLNSVVYGFI
jgi:hypothetical protein